MTKIRKWVAIVALFGALMFVAIAPTVLCAMRAFASNPGPGTPAPAAQPSMATYASVRSHQTSSSSDNNYMWLISIATPIAVIASAWGAVKSVQSSHAETLKEIKTANEATNEKVDTVAEKVEKLGREVAYIQGQFDRQNDD